MVSCFRLDKPRGNVAANSLGKTQIGSIHENSGAPNQDACMWFDCGKFSFAGVFDGHGDDGHSISELASQTMKDNLKAMLEAEPKTDIEKALRDAFKAFSDAIDVLGSSVSSGCTASVVIVRGDECVIGSIGDSTVVVMTLKGAFTSALKPKFKTKNHRIELETERERIKAAGGKVFEAYVLDKDDPNKVSCGVYEIRFR